jgi:hypothetical protein
MMKDDRFPMVAGEDKGERSMTLHPQFVIDEKGKRHSVLLPMNEYQELLEKAQDVIDAALIDEVKDMPQIPWDKVKAKRGRRRRS